MTFGLADILFLVAFGLFAIEAFNTRSLLAIGLAFVALGLAVT